MAYPYNEGFVNAGYHDSETLEMDRGPNSRQKSSFHQNRYYDDMGYGEETRGNRSSQTALPMNNVQQEFDYDQSPRYPASRNDPYRGGYVNSSFQPEPEQYLDERQERPYYITDSNSISEEDDSKQITATASVHKESSGIARMDNERITQANEDFLEKLSEMSSEEITREIQKLPTNLKEKQKIRNTAVKMKTKALKNISQKNCCGSCMHSTKLSCKKSKQLILDVFRSIQLWRKTLKVIGGKFGTSILSYFVFIKWLLTFNIFSFIVNFSFITIPQFVDMSPNNLSFTGLELLTGAGYFEHTVLYYGYYTNATIRKDETLAPYNMQLAYIFTIGLYLLACFLLLLYSMAKSFRDNFINPSSISGNAAKLLCSWDFSITSQKIVKLRQKSLSTQIKETLSDKLMEDLTLTLNQKIARFFLHVTAWLLCIGTAAGCCAGVYFLCDYVSMNTYPTALTEQAATLQVPIVVSIINVVVPLLYSLYGRIESYKYPRHQIYVVILRNVLLKMSIIGILCYFWLHSVAESQGKCWESVVGQEIYRLVVIDFIFALIGSFFGEFIRRIIGTHCCKKLGVPEFDIATNVLDLIYAQTLAWIGIFFSPLLPIIQMIKLFIIFYVKKVSLMKNCTPPRRVWRASQMTTVFIFLLFFPSFTGVLCVIAVTVWRRTPSQLCGPFRELQTPFDSITRWISTISIHENLLWVVWIYKNIIESVLFYYILTMIVLIISYLYWQIVQGQKEMVKILLEQIANEGKDKAFLLKEMARTQRPNKTQPFIPYKEYQLKKLNNSEVPLGIRIAGPERKMLLIKATVIVTCGTSAADWINNGLCLEPAVSGVNTQRTPSQLCGPFRELQTPFDSITRWISTISIHENLLWVVWIYKNIIESVLFYYILTMIVLIISYLYWQIVQGQKEMVKILLEQIANEGKDKAFLLKEMARTQRPNKTQPFIPYKEYQLKDQPSNKSQNLQFTDETSTQRPLRARSSESHAAGIPMMQRQQAEEHDSPSLSGGVSRESSRTSDAKAMVLRARQQADMERSLGNTRPGNSDALEMVRRARLEAEMDRGPH
ncbi:transmembrane channel-like protein 5 [Bombina bombina]|uniref:transmembrane channel-like protein 5 n=1 Tax=Bombina bombina TaxID=8345 RepID=UPI00235A5E73|nr:transmembrane channel-like protein 5 [Bombina bombina]